ncbi:MAG TPA: hypothetical protein DEP35_08925 [Deltaproteobacteria bacterium]|nr:hypothetical protein [Deltaproteobacteria bacterium]
MVRVPRLDLPALKRALRRRRNLVLLGVLVLLVAGRVALPFILRREIVSQTDKAITGHIELDDLDLSLFRGGVTLHGLRVYAEKLPTGPPSGRTSGSGQTEPAVAAPKGAPIFSVSHLWVQISWFALVRKTLAVKEIALDTFSVRLDRARDGGLVLPHPQPSPGPAPPEPEHKTARPWKVFIERLHLRDGQIGFRDFAVAEKPQEFETTVEALDAQHLALVIDTSGATPGKIDLDALIGGGRLVLDATYSMKAAGPAIDSHLTLTDFPIGGTRVYLPDLGWSDLHGLFSANLHHLFELGGAHQVSGTVTLADVAMAVPGTAEPPLGWKELSVEIGRVDVVGRSAAVSKVILDSAHVLLDPQGQSFVPAVRPKKKQEVAAVPSAVPAAAPSPTAAPPWTWKVSELVVKAARVDVLGGSRPLALVIDAKVDGLSHELGNRVPFSITVGEGSGSLAVDGGFTVAPPGFDGSIRIADLELGPLVEPFAPAIGRLLHSGAARAELKLAAGRPASPDAPSEGGVRASGKLGVTALEVVDADPKDFRVAWKDLALEAGELFVPGILGQAGAAKSGPVRVALDRFQLTEPAIRLTRTQTGLVLPQTGSSPAPTGATKEGTEPAPSPAAAPAKGDTGAPVEAEVKQMEVTRARIEVTDRTTKPFYRAEVFPLDFMATGVRWPGPAAKQVKLSARTREGGLLVVKGSLDPRGSVLSAKLEGLPLAPFNPYATATGHSVGGGAAALESQIKFAGPKYDANTHIVIHKLDVRGEEGNTLFLERFGVPLELALALLTDVEGDIVLDVPLSHDASGTSAGIGTIVGEALAHALLNAIASPLKLITAVAEIGGKAENLAPKALAFLPGRTELAPGEADRVDQIAALLVRSPGLRLHLQGDTGPEDDRWLREQALRTRLEGGEGLAGRLRGLTTERGERKAALAYLADRAAGKDTTLPEEYKPWFEAKVAAEVVPQENLQSLAAQRAARVQSLLVEGSGIAADRIVLDPPSREGAQGQPSVALGLGAAPRPAKAEASAP